MYNSYCNYVKDICNEGKLENFKRNPIYTNILEHVTFEQGKLYFKEILSNTEITSQEIIDFSTINDGLGNPRKELYSEYIPDFEISPTSLRYIYHSHLILSYIKRLKEKQMVDTIDIVEIGGGYGGLCLAIHYFSEKYGVNIKSYRICDLPDIIKLQRLYLQKINSNIKVEFVDSITYGENISSHNMFLISNYCFSEISMEHQNNYREKLFPKISHGFMTWNIIPIYNFGFDMQIEEEIPCTNPSNKYIYF
jgi:hypothetical protein